MRGLLRLTWRQATAHRAVPAALVLLVLLVATVATAWPRLMAGVDDRQTTYEVAAASPLARDVVAVLPGVWPQLPPPEPGSTPFEPAVEERLGGLLVALEEVRADQPEPLRGMLGDPELWVQTAEFAIVPPPDPQIGRQFLSLKVDPQLTDHVELVAGQWPQAPQIVGPDDGLSREEQLALTLDDQAQRRRAAIEATGPLEVAISAPAAEILEWEVGTERQVSGETVPVLLTGVFAADDLQADVWAHNGRSAEPYVVDDLNLGTAASAAAYLHPAWDGQFPVGFPVAGYRTQMWYPLDVEALAADEVVAAAAQLTGFTTPQQLPGGDVDGGDGLGPSGFALPDVRFATDLGLVLERIQEQQAITSTVLTIVAAGPLGVTLAVFLLGARLLVSRRRSALALLSARGGSGWQLRAMLALEGLAIGVPAAAAGAALAVALLPGRTTPRDLVLTALVALVPAVMLAASSSPRGLREGRADLGTRRGRFAWVAEAVLLGLTGVALVLLLQRGVTPGAGRTDVLLTAVPLLLALSTSVVVMRVYPLPVRALAGALRRRPGLTAVLGSARAVRDSAGGLVPAVALVVGVSVALFSAVLSSTVSTGVMAAGWTSVGADLRLSGPAFDADAVAALDGVPGVSGVATIGGAGTVSISGERLEIATVEPEAVRAVQADGPGIDHLPDGLIAGLTADGGVPAVLSSDAADTLGAGVGAQLEAGVGSGVTLEVVGVMRELAGSGATGDVVVDRATFAEVTGEQLLPRVLLVDVADGADVSAVLERTREVEPNALAQTPAGEVGDFLSSPMAAGMNDALLVAVVLSLVLVVVAVVMTQLVGAPARARLLAVLRTLGAGREHARGIVAWELAPLALVSVVAGAVLGVVVPWVVLAGMDLRALTGGVEQPRLVLDPLLVGGVLGGVVLVTALAVAVSTLLSSRTDVAAELRMGEES